MRIKWFGISGRCLKCASPSGGVARPVNLKLLAGHNNSVRTAGLAIIECQSVCYSMYNADRDKIMITGAGFVSRTKSDVVKSISDVSLMDCLCGTQVI